MLNRFDFKVERDTPRKTIIEPEIWGPPERGDSTWKHLIFRFISLSFPGVYSCNKCFLGFPSHFVWSIP